MVSAFDFFDRIFCINLDRRPERWVEVQREFAAIGVLERVERFSAIERKKGWEGCLLSHQRCVKLAQASDAERILIFEDDVRFMPPIEERLGPALRALDGEPWELFFLGADVASRARRIGNHLIAAKMYQTHAYAIHRRAFAKIARAISPIDVWYANNLRCYGARAPLAMQAVGHSDTGLGITDRNVSRSYKIFVEASYPGYLWGRAYYASRRKLGRTLTGIARTVGIPLTFVGGRPRLTWPRERRTEGGRRR